MRELQASLTSEVHGDVLTHSETAAGPAELVRRFGGASAIDRTAALSPSFLIRLLDGCVEVDLPGPRPNDGVDALERLSMAIGAAEPEELRDSYVLIEPATGVRSVSTGVWLVSVRDGLLAAAFEFATHEDAIAAAPPGSQRICGEKLVERVVWAIVARDLAEILSILGEDFTYTDQKRGFTLSGAATAINHLLLMGYFGVKTIAGLEIRALNADTVQVTGSVVEPDPFADADDCGRWRMVVGIEAGRIAWAVHHPDLLPGARTT